MSTNENNAAARNVPSIAARMAAIHANNEAAMAELTFGVELETEGRSRRAVAEALAAHFGVTAVYEGTYYDKWTVALADGRKWTCMSDGSLAGGGCEVVSPICKLADMVMVQDVVRVVRSSGAHISDSCGMHVHVGGLDAREVGRLVGSMARHEDMLFRAFASEARQHNHFCKPIDPNFIAAVKRCSRVTNRTLCKAWYSSHGDNYMTLDRAAARDNHYHGSRYHGLNLHSWFQRGTVEFRYFEGTLHAGVVRAFITICLALAANAKMAGGSGGAAVRPGTSDKVRMTKLIRRLGCYDETVLAHLTARIGGGIPRRRSTVASVA